jgi:hypothetical protein
MGDANNNKQEVFYCTSCGTRVRKNDMFCPICGNRIDGYEYIQVEDSTPYNDAVSYPKQEPVEKQGSSIGKTIGIIGALSLIASAFLPFASFEVLGFGETITLLDGGDGIFFLIAGIIVLILFLANSKVLLFFTAVAVGGLSYFEYNATMETLNEMGVFAGLADKQVGFYAMILGAVFVAIGALLSQVD